MTLLTIIGYWLIACIPLILLIAMADEDLSNDKSATIFYAILLLPFTIILLIAIGIYFLKLRNEKKMKKEQYLFAAKRIVLNMMELRFSAGSTPQYELYKEYVLFFSEFYPDFSEQRFKKYINLKLKEHEL